MTQTLPLDFGRLSLASPAPARPAPARMETAVGIAATLCLNLTLVVMAFVAGAAVSILFC